MKVFRMSPRARLPERSSEGAVGYDLFVCLPEDREFMVIHPGKAELVPTGLKIDLGWHWAKIESRSGLALKSGVSVPCGVIDPDYRGEWGVVIRNNGPLPLSFKHGDKVAQFVLMSPHFSDVKEVDSEDKLTSTKRGGGGFGSSGS